MMTRKAEEKLKQSDVTAKQPTEQVMALYPDLATLTYRTSDEGFDSNVEAHLGKFLNRFGVFGNFDERDRKLYMLRFQKYLDLKAALDGITDDELLKEPEAEAVLHGQLTMSKDGFTTKELTTQRVYESQGRPREAPGFFTGVKRRLFCGGPEQAPQEAQP